MKHPLAFVAVSSLLSACVAAVAQAPTKAEAAASGELVADLGDSCWIVFQDDDDDFWFGSDGQGLCRWDGTTFTRFTTKDGLCNDHIRGIQQHVPSGDLLITTNEGVSRFDGRRFTKLPVTVMKDSDPPEASGWVLHPDDVWLPLQGGQQGPFATTARRSST